LQVRTVQLRISGRVQGVGFRESMCLQAERVGVCGWVRNRTDGSVEALIQGPNAAVQAMLAWAERGPTAARVEQVAGSAPAAEYARDYARFERWPTA
jgi:acylphosphatase